ncbi:MAG: hypothetical protein WCP92_05385 [bacterium]
MVAAAHALHAVPHVLHVCDTGLVTQVHAFVSHICELVHAGLHDFGHCHTQKFVDCH